MTRIIDPDPATLLGEDKCEVCWNGHCVAVPCLNSPQRWTLAADPQGIPYNQSHWNPDPKIVENEVEVSLEAKFTKGDPYDLACSVVESTGEVTKPFYDVATDFLKSGACP